ncbi:hypothetical protein AAFP35_17435 [Gordonia sp. CPCC 206044]|uniref:hypothetical protein n=1 Tax=Gordonia sp. CPCC 206044 TaxID=3140793 RepID=UPI003AF34681
MSLPSLGGGGPSEPQPDIPFSLGMDVGAPNLSRATPTGDDAVFGERLVAALAKDAPPGWHSMAATFSLTVGHQTALVIFATAEDEYQTTPSQEAFGLVREQRDLSASTGRGPWWRLAVSVQQAGAPVIEVDHAEQPFGANFLFPPDAYRADFAAYPDRDVPLWLAAHAFHEGRQHRTPEHAVQQSHSRRSDVAPDDQWPSLDVMWARWSALAAVFASMTPGFGPGMAPGIAVFEAATHSGSTLVRLPGDRAVLSGGVFDSHELKSTYIDGAELPDLYAGAPIWVGDATLNVRLETGMLSFCWWYERGHWHRGQSPDAVASAGAVPAVASTDDTANAIVRAISADQSANLVAVAEAFVGAVETGTVTSTLVESLLPRSHGYDVDAALVSLSVAGRFDGR